MPHRKNTYVDCSVFGGVHDEEFCEASQLFFEQAVAGKFLVLVSQITLDELVAAPPDVQNVLEALPTDVVQEVPVETDAVKLAEAYVDRGVLTKKWLDDAIHVAVATLSNADLILSWNFKHMVNYDKIRKFNSVNLFLGYKQVDIRSPREVIYDEENEDI